MPVSEQLSSYLFCQLAQVPCAEVCIHTCTTDALCMSMYTYLYEGALFTSVHADMYEDYLWQNYELLDRVCLNKVRAGLNTS